MRVHIHILQRLGERLTNHNSQEESEHTEQTEPNDRVFNRFSLDSNFFRMIKPEVEHETLVYWIPSLSEIHVVM